MATAADGEQFKVTTKVLVILATVFAFFAIFTSWIDRQALDTDEWVATSGDLLEDRAISDAIADYAVEQLYASVDVSEEIRERLPKKAKPLASPAASGMREIALRVAQDALQRPRLQATWRQANETAHQTLVAILEDKSGAVSTSGGKVVLDLRPIVEELAARVGVDKEVANKIPPDVAQIEIVESGELGTAQTVTKLLRGLDLVFTIGSLLLFALAAYLAHGRRWMMVAGYGLGLVVVGVLVLVLRHVAGGVIVDQLVTDPAAETAATHAFSIGTDLLASIARTVVMAGLLFVLAGFLASPAGSAVATRRVLAPTFAERAQIVWAGFAVLVVLLLIASPPHSASELWARLVLILLGGFGLEALSRKIRHEFPDAHKGQLRERIKERIRELGAEGAKRTRAALGDLGDMMERQPDPEDLRLERLKKLGELRDSGVLTDAEFESEKQRLLSREPAPAPAEAEPEAPPEAPPPPEAPQS